MQTATEAAKTAPVSLEEAWSECVRELGVRSRCFDNWVNAGKLSWSDARDRMARLGVAALVLKHLLEHEQGLCAHIQAKLSTNGHTQSVEE